MKTCTVFVLVAFITVGMEMACARTPLLQDCTKTIVCFRATKTWSLPQVPKGTFGICVERCSGDASCPKGMKCCSNGCGHVCKAALPEWTGVLSLHLCLWAAAGYCLVQVPDAIPPLWQHLSSLETPFSAPLQLQGPAEPGPQPVTSPPSPACSPRILKAV
ncbi:hypothetical protein QTO34_009250 [Cnephaeus nilssonii]|uniref:WAP domain-containing protein n=1 Tax=Cnephaeus nilssonii TaxID=3371016 RepID=A0AA40HHJ6_CNENI|nr:hypothetical protein QTO34_009250 [Eptesicus nilssonii]